VKDKLTVEQRARIARQRARNFKGQKTQVREAFATASGQARGFERRKARRRPRKRRRPSGGGRDKTLRKVQNKAGEDTGKCTDRGVTLEQGMRTGTTVHKGQDENATRRAMSRRTRRRFGGFSLLWNSRLSALSRSSLTPQASSSAHSKDFLLNDGLPCGLKDSISMLRGKHPRDKQNICDE
jgi:hypothetical protein